MKKPFAIFITDTHMDDGNEHIVYNSFMHAFDYAVGHDIKYIFHGGDVFTERTGLVLLNLIFFNNILREAKKRDLEVYVIGGNHDKQDLDSEMSYLDVYDDKCVVIDKEVTIKFDGINVSFLPYFKENGSYLKRLVRLIAQAKQHQNLVNILITHTSIDGVSQNKGKQVKNNIKPSLFSVFKKVFVGHYHNRQQIGKNIFYVGSDRANNFGEDNHKGFTVIYDNGDHEYVQGKFKKFTSIKIDLNLRGESEIIHLIKARGDNENLRFILRGTKDQVKAINANKLRKMGVSIKVEEINNIDSESNEQLREFKKFDRQEIQKNFLLFCKQNEVKGSLFSLGFSYVKKLKNVEH